MSDLSPNLIPAETPAPKYLSGLRTVLRDVMSRPSGAIGLSLVVFHVLLALTSPLYVPYDFKTMNSMLMLMPPSSEHWLGTDHLGRDVLTRVLLGGREALLVTGVATPIAVVWGGFMGILFGLVGGRIDEVLMRVVDAFLSLPWILKMLVLIVTFGSGIEVLIPTLAFFYGIPVIRIARAATHDVVARDFISAAKARGHGRMTIIRRELVPNVLDTLMVEGAMRWSWMLLAFSSLSFLGFGVSPPTPDWGLMIADARGFMSFAPWGVLGPVIALSSLIIGINLTADALAKALGIDRAQKAPV
ncbi:MAG: ABC transporter permease [Paracoccaceae bacterium]|jgi:peptide/nickel transport system permease protein|nr:peptide ABC transporter permease [Marinovum sp.]MDC0540416.1 ABC transporter permease [Paracoccaceae bacterium]MBP08532.1 peptide ABC transporter permease [Marinovum sp.]MBT5679835.1 ABC transporter permease [Marinovum sp.]MBT6526856.1 ABC transporter permease [Marinovum sp.]|tara:strand:+ start:4834 stop:5739 length:906 start_codon:yes stop_codon:yes gene_type:complete